MVYWQFTHAMSHRKWYIQICLQFVMLLGWRQLENCKTMEMEGLSFVDVDNDDQEEDKYSIQSTKRPIGNNNNATDILIDTNIKLLLEC